MDSLKRLFQFCVLSACLLVSATAFASEGEVAAPAPAAAVASSEATEPSSPEEGMIDFGNLGMPDPTNRSCTATSNCSVVGGTPITCNGTSTCTFGSSWVTCDGQDSYCTCVPQNVPTCYDGACFCNCWAAAPKFNWGACRQACCFEP